jgi:hypothetical protein
MKLGPDNLGAAYSRKFDKIIAASVPNFFLRKRLQEIARLIAEALNPMLTESPRPNLHFLNIASGPCSDSINALIILNKQFPNLLKNVSIKIHALDLQSQAPAFGARALENLKNPEAPLHGLNISLNYVAYNWANPDRLREYIKKTELKDSIIAVSSEGGLFNYGTDEEIIANLTVLNELPSQAIVLFGTLTPAEGIAVSFAPLTGNTNTIRRTIRGFKEIVDRTPWTVKESHDNGMNYIFELRRR